MSHVQSWIICCGEFGAQVAGHMEARESTGLKLLRWNGAATTRQAAGELARRHLEALGDARGGLLHMVAAADEAVSSGVAIATLDHLSDGQESLLWLALPSARADKASCARAFATLLELESLSRAGRSFTVYLSERRGDPSEPAQRFGDALLYHARRSASPHPLQTTCRGFGLGVVRDPVATLKRRLAPQLAARVVEQYLRSPDPAHLLPGLTEVLQRPVRPLLIPVEQTPIFQQRWSERGGGGDLEALLDYYEPDRLWHGQAREYWDMMVEEARNRLASALGYAWRSGFETIYEEARASLAQTHRLLEAAIAQCEESVNQQQQRFEAAMEAAGTVETGLSELDRLVAAHLLESMRLGALERIALAIDGAVELVMDGLWAKSVKVRHLLRAVQENPSATLSVRPAHGLSMVLSADQEQEWLQAVDPRLTRRGLLEAATPDVERLLESARRDLERHIRTENAELHLPRGHRVRQSWFAGMEPGVRLAGAEAVPYACEVSPGLPADYREELLTRAASVREEPVEWFIDEWVIYVETQPFDLGQLAALPVWSDAYQSVSAAVRAGLHVLTESEGGWPQLGAPRGNARREVSAGQDPESLV